jgi:hypothetical protein
VATYALKETGDERHGAIGSIGSNGHTFKAEPALKVAARRIGLCIHRDLLLSIFINIPPVLRSRVRSIGASLFE